MSRTDAVTRILFEAFSAAEVRLFYFLGYAAIAVFLYGFYVQIRKYRRGAALKLEGGLWARLGAMISSVLSHRTIDRRDPAAGGAHRLIGKVVEQPLLARTVHQVRMLLRRRALHLVHARADRSFAAIEHCIQLRELVLGNEAHQRGDALARSGDDRVEEDDLGDAFA